MPRNKYPEETVQKILDASLKLFLEKGYEETTVLDIIREIGIKWIGKIKIGIKNLI